MGHQAFPVPKRSSARLLLCLSSSQFFFLADCVERIEIIQKTSHFAVVRPFSVCRSVDVLCALWPGLSVSLCAQISAAVSAQSFWTGSGIHQGGIACFGSGYHSLFVPRNLVPDVMPENANVLYQAVLLTDHCCQPTNQPGCLGYQSGTQNGAAGQRIQPVWDTSQHFPTLLCSQLSI